MKKLNSKDAKVIGDWSMSWFFHSYNEAINLAREVDDQGTDDLLTTILKRAEIQRAQIEHAP